MASSSPMAVKQSISSATTATRHPEPDQMEVDIRGRDHCSSSAPSSSTGPAQSNGNENMDDQELISPKSRLSRIPTLVPSISHSSQPPNAAIPASKNSHINTYAGQDVHDFVINSASLSTSTASPSQGQLPPPETSVSSFPQPITQHGLSHPIRRPRTSAFSRALAPNHGIPQRLPPPPRPINRTSAVSVSIQPTSPVDTFQDLRNSYLTMLSTEPTDNTMAAPITPMSANTASSEAQSSGSHMAARDLEMLVNLITSPAFKDLDSFEDTSPCAPSLMDDFDASPYETPYHEFLNTPVIPEGAQDDMLTSPHAEYLDFDYTYGNSIDEPVVQSKPTTDFDMLLQISPETPMLDSFDPTYLYANPLIPPTAQKFPAAAATSSLDTATSGRRRSTATGIRKGITPDALLDEDAPTQPRKYTTPSATSRKDVPAVFARKRSRSTAFGEEEDQLDELPPNPTERDLIDAKRRQNTVAARRSRKRKLEQMQSLERSVKVERHQKEVLQTRLDMMVGICRSAGLPCPDFPPIEIPDDL